MNKKPNSLLRRASGTQGSKGPTIMTHTDFNLEESSPQLQPAKQLTIDGAYPSHRANYTVKSVEDKRFEFDSTAAAKKRKHRRAAKRKRVMTQAHVGEAKDARRRIQLNIGKEGVEVDEQAVKK